MQRTFGQQNNKNIKPTFGISFGLPHQGAGGYPVNPHSPNPFVNPYGGTFGGGGINLGLVSVNPLVSLQVTKDDYGEKVIKPFINLHVTPNDYLVHKANRFFSYKKGLVLNNHFHHHTHPKPPFHYGGGYGYYKPGPIIHGPPHIHHEPEYFHHSKPIHDEDIYLDHPPHSFHNKPHFHDQPNFEHYEEPIHGSEGFFGRAVNFTDGNPLINRYQQQYDNGQSYSNNFNSPDDNARLDRQLNPVKFPTSRKRRDVTIDEQINPTKTKVGR